MVTNTRALTATDSLMVEALLRGQINRFTWVNLNKERDTVEAFGDQEVSLVTCMTVNSRTIKNTEMGHLLGSKVINTQEATKKI